MADTYGFQDTGSKNHMANGCPDIGRNDPGVGCGLRDAGVDRNNRESKQKRLLVCDYN